VIGSHDRIKNVWVSLVASKTWCVARVDLRLRDSRCRSPKCDVECCLPACTDLGQYPTGNHVFGAQSRSGFGSQPIPFTLTTFRVYASTLNFDSRLISTQQNSILGLWLAVTHARFAPARLQTISSPQRSRHGSAILPFWCRSCILRSRHARKWPWAQPKSALKWVIAFQLRFVHQNDFDHRHNKEVVVYGLPLEI